MKRFIIILTLSLSIVFTQSTKRKKRSKNKVVKNEISSIVQDASESVPRRISYQGLITKADGSPTEDGSYEILFKLYGSADGGDPVWSENLEVTVNFHEETPLSINLPNQIKSKIETTDAALKGQTVSSSYKPATLDNGLSIQVPPFIESGDEIIVDTRTIEYVKKV